MKEGVNDDSFASDLHWALTTSKSILLTRLLPAQGPGTQQGIDINIWWTEMTKSR